MRTRYQWIVPIERERISHDPAVEAIARELGVLLPTAQLLVNRGCATPDEAKRFIQKEEDRLYDPFLMLGMEAAAERIVQALREHEKIVIYGDYDVDGVTSVSVLYLYLKDRGADVAYYIPSRAGEGYGVSEGAVRRLAEEGCRLIVTVDTGITASREAKLAAELGVDFLVTDHHECHEELPRAAAVVNPRQPGCGYPFKELAGVGVVFKLITAVESRLCPDKTLAEVVRAMSLAYGDLVAIGTVADVMPIRDENRLIVSLGLNLIEKSPRPGLAELMEATREESRGITKRKITASYIGYTIAPRLNAAGRIRDASLAVELLLTSDREYAAGMARHLCAINHERQTEENKIIDRAYALIAAYHDFERDPVIVLEDETWHHGVIGIVASRITEKYGRPSILISFEGSGEGKNPDDMGKGSGRSVKGMNLVEALGSCAPLLEKYGGHELAAGLSITRKNLPAFRESINAYAREHLVPEDMKPQLEAECVLGPEDLVLRQAEELYQLEPYGVSNPTPVFVLYGAEVTDVTAVGGGKHTRLTLRIGGRTVTAMCFRQAPAELDIYPGDTADLMFTLDVNEFGGQRNLQLIVKDVRLTEHQQRAEDAEQELYDRIRQGEVAGLERFAPRVVPTRDDFAAVYTILRRELKMDRTVFTARALRYLLIQNGCRVGYVKMKFILLTFRELNLMSVKRLRASTETFAFHAIPQTGKTDLDSAQIYRKLKSDFGL